MVRKGQTLSAGETQSTSPRPQFEQDAIKDLDQEFRQFRNRLDELLNYVPLFPFSCKKPSGHDPEA